MTANEFGDAESSSVDGRQQPGGKPVTRRTVGGVGVGVGRRRQRNRRRRCPRRSGPSQLLHPGTKPSNLVYILLQNPS